MPKGAYKRGLFTEWTDDEDAFVKQACTSTASYADIADAFNARFPHQRKSRSAILGRAARMGWAADKPTGNNRGGKPQRGIKRARNNDQREAEKAAKRLQEMVPVVFKKGHPALRNEDDRGTSGLPRSRKLASNDPRVIERRKGNIPTIVEEKPLTSVPIGETDGCKWPTSADVRCLEVCGAKIEIGSYCARHGAVAYRVMPTHKRNAAIRREPTEYRKRLEHDAAQVAAEFVGIEGPDDDETLLLTVVPESLL